MQQLIKMPSQKEVLNNKYGLEKTFFKKGSRMEAAFNYFLKYRNQRITVYDLAKTLNLDGKNITYILQRLKFKGIIKIAERKWHEIYWQLDENSEIVQKRCRECFFGYLYHNPNGYLKCDRCSYTRIAEVEKEFNCRTCQFSWKVNLRTNVQRKVNYCPFCSNKLNEVTTFHYAKNGEIK